jgi:hypothetical protein
MCVSRGCRCPGRKEKGDGEGPKGYGLGEGGWLLGLGRRRKRPGREREGQERRVGLEVDFYFKSSFPFSFFSKLFYKLI